MPVAGAPVAGGVADRIALVVETSGSTGYPKRVALSAGALRASHAASGRALGGPGQWLLALPPHYIAGVQVLIRSLLDGTEAVAAPQGPFRPDGFVAAAALLDPGVRHYTSLVPVQLSRLLDDEEGVAALTRFDGVVVGGQRLPLPLAERAAAVGVRLHRSYGSSETAGGCVYDGVPFDGVELSVADGEVAVGGAVLAEGYLGDPRLTAERFRGEGARRRYLTGDTGSIEGGVLGVSGRRDRVLVSGGTNVSLDRLEAVLRDRPGWDGVVVLARDDEQWGQVPVVVAAVDVDLAEARAIAAQAIGVAAQPAAVRRLDTVPMTASGKPDRVAIARLLAPAGPRH
ncbi:o-succinylbenzoate--CoA ligase [Mycetocola reblochoni]|nr:o-succinylbenzoate--CoA ligase [Mycetocola reblochoni]